MNRAIDVPAACARVRDQVSLSSIVKRSGVKLERSGREWKAACPFHADRTPSFTIYAGDRRFMCFGCGAQGDALDFLQRAHRLSLIEAIRMLDGGALPMVQRTEASEEPERDRSAEVLAMWRNTGEITGTPAEAYLRRRGIAMDLPPCLRFARLRPPKVLNLSEDQRTRRPALVAVAQDLAGTPTGLQRTYLTEDGRKADFPEGDVKFSFGRLAGSAIQLAPPDANLIVVEGLEDGLSLLQEVGVPVWVAAGTSMLPRIALPPDTPVITIGADSDAAGERAAMKAADAYREQGRRVRIMRPDAAFKDFNAQLMGQGA